MGNIHRELNSLRMTLQQQRATVNALKREIKRLKGEEVINSGRLSDEERILDSFAWMPENVEEARFYIKLCKEQMDVKRKRIAELKDQLDRRFPLTPCAMFKAIRRHKREKPKVKYI